MFDDQSTTWPIRFKPYDDEVLSSWLARLARSFGLTLFQFQKWLFQRINGLPIDIDQISDPWFFDVLSRGAGVSPERIAVAARI